jgi:hypothetical protein
MHQRALAGTDPSDATPPIAQTMAASMAAWPTATVIETSGAPRVALARALQAVETERTGQGTPTGPARS